MPAAPRIPVPSSIRLEGSGVAFTATSLNKSDPSVDPPFAFSGVAEANSRSSDADVAMKIVETKLNGLLSPTEPTAVGPSTVPPIVKVKEGVASQGELQPTLERALSTKVKSYACPTVNPDSVWLNEPAP